jgi:hypothetical protein
MSFALDTNPWNPSSNAVLDVVLNNATIESTQYRGIRVRDNGPYLVKLVANDSTIDEIWYQQYADGDNVNKGNYGVLVELYLNNTTADVSRVKAGTLVIDGVEVVFPKTVTYDCVSSFQNALNSLNPGDTLVLPAGTIITTGTFSVPHGVTIVGDSNGGTVIRQNSAGQDDIFNCKGDVTVKNITFESNRKGYAITDNTKNHDSAGNITVINCSFKGIASEKNYGIYKNLNGNLIIKDCTFDNYNNAICGVSNGNGTTTTVTGCTFTNINSEAVGYVTNNTPDDFEAVVIANNTGLTEENVIGY